MAIRITRSGLGSALGLALVVGGAALSVQGEQPGDLKVFMRRKLDYSQKVLEGLTLEDYALVAEKARQKNLDGATLAYVRMTIQCVKCHEYTRDNRITLRDSRVPHIR